jgi:hypothetical protein
LLEALETRELRLVKRPQKDFANGTVKVPILMRNLKLRNKHHFGVMLILFITLWCNVNPVYQTIFEFSL